MLYEEEQDFPFVADLLNDLGSPCWECAEKEDEFIGFNVSVPFFQGAELTAILAFIDFDSSDGDVDVHLRLMSLNNELVVEDYGIVELFFLNLTQKYESLTQNLLEVDDRGCNCPAGGYANWWGISGGVPAVGIPPNATTNSFCLCVTFDGNQQGESANLQAPNCCDDGYTQNYLDGQPFEWGIQIQGTWEAWLLFRDNWLGIFDNLPTGPYSGGGSSTNNTTINQQLLMDIKNEQKVLGFLYNHFKSFRDDLPEDFRLVLGSNPDLASRIYLYLNNYYAGVSPSMTHVIDLIHLYSEHIEMSILSPSQIEHILIFEPALSNAINTFLDNSNLNENTALLAVKGIFIAQMCVNPDNPGNCTPQNYPNNFMEIYNFHDTYGNNSVFTGLTGYELSVTQKNIYTYILLNAVLSTLEGQALVKFIQLAASGDVDIFSPTAVGDFVSNFVTLYEELDPVFGFSEEEENWLLVNGDIIAAINQHFEDSGQQVNAEEGIPVLAAWILKKAAQASAGALIDIGVQLVMEYWFGNHDDWGDAWEELDINWVQVLQSSGESLITNGKYATLISAFGDLTNYLVLTDNPTLDGAAGHFAFGAISGWIGNYAGDQIGKMFHYINKYDVDDVILKLDDLNLKPAFFEIGDFRNFLIDYFWTHPGWTSRGIILEELLTYSRYAGFNWIGPQNGPIDYTLNGLAVQLKTSVHPTSMSPSSFRNACNKLRDAVNNGWNGNNFTSARLDIMIPANRNPSDYTNWMQTIIDNEYNNPNLPNSVNLTLDVGYFTD